MTISAIDYFQPLCISLPNFKPGAEKGGIPVFLDISIDPQLGYKGVKGRLSNGFTLNFNLIMFFRGQTSFNNLIFPAKAKLSLEEALLCKPDELQIVSAEHIDLSQNTCRAHFAQFNGRKMDWRVKYAFYQKKRLFAADYVSEWDVLFSFYNTAPHLRIQTSVDGSSFTELPIDGWYVFDTWQAEIFPKSVVNILNQSCENFGKQLYAYAEGTKTSKSYTNIYW